MASAKNTPKKKESAGKSSSEKKKTPRKKTVPSAVTQLAGLSLSDEFNNLFTIAVIRTLNELCSEKMSEEEFLRRMNDLTEDKDNLLWKYVDRLKSEDTDILLDKSDRKNWRLKTCSGIPMPLSLAERVYLRAVLESRYCPIFFDEDEKTRILERLKDVPSIGLEKNVVFAGSGGHPRTFPPDEISKIRKLLSSVRYRKEIEYSNNANDGKVYLHSKGFPVKIEYSVFDDRFRLSLWSSDENRPIKINISSMYDISETGRNWDNPLTPQKMMETKLSPEPIRMTLTGKDHQFDRALYSFSVYDTVIERTGENEYTFTLRYYGFDLPEIIDKIMSFGPAMRVLSPSDAIDRIKRRLTAWK